jgi:hypothetical protein
MKEFGSKRWPFGAPTDPTPELTGNLIAAGALNPRATMGSSDIHTYQEPTPCLVKSQIRAASFRETPPTAVRTQSPRDTSQTSALGHCRGPPALSSHESRHSVAQKVVSPPKLLSQAPNSLPHRNHYIEHQTQPSAPRHNVAQSNKRSSQDPQRRCAKRLLVPREPETTFRKAANSPPRPRNTLHKTADRPHHPRNDVAHHNRPRSMWCETTSKAATITLDRRH